jgi:hypothetical protein
MSDSSEAPNEPKKFRHKEYQDAHYHDDEEVAQPPEDDRQGPRKTPAKNSRFPSRRPIPRRHFED